MPNWCNNTLTINKMDPEFEKIIEEKGFSFAQFVPLDEPTPETISDYFGMSCDASAKWGTKWDISEPEAAAEDLLCNGSAFFETAWSPPIEFLQALHKLYPLLEFSFVFYEEGVGFCGEAFACNGRFEYAVFDRGNDPRNFYAFMRDFVDEDYGIEEFPEEILDPDYSADEGDGI